MTRSEYQDLVEFLGTKFDAIDRRLEAIDRRLDAIDRRLDAIDRRLDAIETRLTRVEVCVEENSHHIQILAERIGALEEKMDREFRAVRAEMADGFGTQGELIRGLEIRMGRWEGKSA